MKASDCFIRGRKVSRHFLSFRGVVWAGGALFGFPFAGVAGCETSFSLPLIRTRGGVAVCSVTGGEGLGSFSFVLCDTTPFLVGVGDSTRLGVEAGGADTEEGPAE